MPKGGDMGKKEPQKAIILEFDFDASSEFDLSQEDKSRVEIPDLIKKCLSKIISFVNNDIVGKIDNYYQGLKQHSNDDGESSQNSEEELSDSEDSHTIINNYSDTEEETPVHDDNSIGLMPVQQVVKQHFKGYIELEKIKEQFEKYLVLHNVDGNIMDVEIYNKLINKNKSKESTLNI